MIPTGIHPDLRALIDRCITRFRAWTGHEPEAVACAPGRVNIIGEHTDYNEGFVLPMAINRWCVAAGRRVEGRGRVLSDDLGESAEYDPARPDARALHAMPWARYPVGVLWSMRGLGGNRAVGERASVELVVASSVPLGAGLSSSASLELAVGGLADRLLGLGLSPVQLAQIGRTAEHAFAGVPCGIMDQLVSACALSDAAMLIDCRTLERRPVPMPTGVVLVIADSGVRHALAAGKYAQRRESCRRAAGELGVSALRDADLVLLDRRAGVLSEADRACARHVVTENTRVLAFERAIGAGDAPEAGRLMVESHESLRDDFRVSCPELDALVDAAIAVPGVLGSRMTGGGFGGCTVTLCRAQSAAEILRVLGRTAGSGGRVVMRPFVAEPSRGMQAWGPAG